jgi:hypothetical protein
MPTLQINIEGTYTWRSVVQFDQAKRDDVLAALKELAQALGPQVRWSILHDGLREQLHDIHTGAIDPWNDVTPTSPPPLIDVLVSAYDASEDAGVVMMAWRSTADPNRWVISGSEEPIHMPVYGWKPVICPSQVPADLRREAA